MLLLVLVSTAILSILCGERTRGKTAQEPLSPSAVMHFTMFSLSQGSNYSELGEGIPISSAAVG